MASLTTLTNALGYPTTIEQMSARMGTICRLDHYHTLVAVSGHKIVGYAGLIKNYFWEQDGTYVRIQALVVDKEYRRSGIGKKLLAAAEKYAADNGASMLFLSCGNREERRSAHLFYPAMGFEARSTGYVKRLDKSLVK